MPESLAKKGLTGENIQNTVGNTKRTRVITKGAGKENDCPITVGPGPSEPLPMQEPTSPKKVHIPPKDPQPPDGSMISSSDMAIDPGPSPCKTAHAGSNSSDMDLDSSTQAANLGDDEIRPDSTLALE